MKTTVFAVISLLPFFAVFLMFKHDEYPSKKVSVLEMSTDGQTDGQTDGRQYETTKLDVIACA